MRRLALTTFALAAFVLPACISSQALAQPRAPSGAMPEIQGFKISETEQGVQNPSSGLLQIGQAAPEFTLPRVQGGMVSLKDVLAKGPVLVLFTRGATEAASLKQLQIVQGNLQKMNALGIQLVTISTEPMNVQQWAQSKNNFGFDMLADMAQKASQAYGVVGPQGSNPALFSVGKDGKIVGIQLQGNGFFDLNVATAPLRGQVPVAGGDAATAPVPAPIAPAAGMPQEQPLKAIDPAPMANAAPAVVASAVPVNPQVPQVPQTQMAPAAPLPVPVVPQAAMPKPVPTAPIRQVAKDRYMSLEEELSAGKTIEIAPSDEMMVAPPANEKPANPNDEGQPLNTPVME